MGSCDVCGGCDLHYPDCKTMNRSAMAGGAEQCAALIRERDEARRQAKMFGESLQHEARCAEDAIRERDKAEKERDALKAELATVRADPRLSAPSWIALGESWPAERRCVLVQIAPSDKGDAPAVGVGYMRSQSNGPFFVVPGARTGFVVTHWADCLGDDFHARPNWQMPGQPKGVVGPAPTATEAGKREPVRERAVSERAKAFREAQLFAASVAGLYGGGHRILGWLDAHTDAAEAEATKGVGGEGRA